MLLSKLLIIFLTFTVNFSFLKAQTCPYFQTDVDYQGYDINYSLTSSVQACCSACASVTTCKAFTYIISSQACWLKTSVGTSYASVGRVSGVVTKNTVITTPSTNTLQTITTTTTASSLISTTKTYGCFIENNVNYYGFDFFAKYVSSSSECCNLCGQTDTCVVWAFLTDVKYCYLKNAVPPLNQRQNYTNMISGIVTLR